MWKVEQGCNGSEEINFLRLSQGKQVCDVGATTPLSYTLYFFVHVVMGFFIRERLDNFKN